jgi:UDP-N-acetylmuramate dehydrogenase
VVTAGDPRPAGSPAELDEVAARLGDAARRHAPLGAVTTYRVGGTASVATTVEGDADLERLTAALAGLEVPVVVVGKGSNLLVADAGFAGVAVFLGEGMAGIDIEGTTVRAGGAAALPVVARRVGAAGLVGFEWAVGVPGSVGGAVRMNAGGHGSDMAAHLARVRLHDLRSGEDGVVATAELDLGYRRSAVGPDTVVVWAELELAEGPRAEAEARMADIVRWRRRHQPGGPNAGSVFTNPPGDSAGRVIDEAGGRGLRRGTAQVSPKHANFIQADEGGSADDVLALMGEVRDLVLDHAGIALHAETRLVGFPGTPGGPGGSPAPEVVA